MPLPAFERVRRLFAARACPVLALLVAGLGAASPQRGARREADAGVEAVTPLGLLPEACPGDGPIPPSVRFVQLRFHAGFPGWSLEGGVFDDGRYRFDAAAVPNGPGPSWQVSEGGCLPNEVRARVFALFDARDASEAPAQRDPYVPAEHCVASVSLHGHEAAIPQNGCAFARTATAMARVLGEHLRDAEREVHCADAAPCALEFAVGNNGHGHDTYRRIERFLRIERDGRVLCRRGTRRVQRRVDAGDAALAIERFAGLMRGEARDQREGGTYASFDEVRLVSREGSRFASRGTAAHSAALALWSGLSSTLPWECALGM